MSNNTDPFTKPGDSEVQEELFKIYRKKRFIISKMFLYLHLSLPDKIHQLHEINFYNFFRKSLIGAEEDFGSQHHILGNYSYCLPSMPPDYEKIILESLLSMESKNYNHPEEIDKIINHLAALWFYYDNNYNNPPTVLDMKLDIALIKVIGGAKKIYGSLIQKRERESKRLERAKIEQGAKKDERKNIVYELFYRSQQIKKGMRLNTVAKIIREEFIACQTAGIIPKSIKPPSIDSIKTYLKEDIKIHNIFQEK